MKDKFKGVVIGMIMGAMLVPTASATVAKVTKELFYNDIKIRLNGEMVEPKDASGNKVEPFIIDGTTYLPVRSVGNALGLNVEWDSNSNTVLLNESSSDTSLAGIVVYEKGGIKITYNGINKDDFYTDFKFLIENNTNRGITVQARDESINGYMVDGTMSSDVMSGKKANSKLSFFNSELKENGIVNIDELEFSFHIFDEKTLVTQ